MPSSGRSTSCSARSSAARARRRGSSTSPRSSWPSCGRRSPSSGRARTTSRPRRSSPPSTRGCAARRRRRTGRCSRSRPGSASRSCFPRAPSRSSTSSRRTARTCVRSATKASPRTPGAWQARTGARSRATSTRSGRPGPSAGSTRRRASGEGGARPAVAGAALITTVVGSYPQPEWLIDRERLGDRLPPRARAAELWRVAEPYLEEAQDDATRLAVQDMERAGVDVITDGEMRRESYSNRFATALDGIEGETVLHTCFGYAHVVKDKCGGYPFLGELNGCAATHISLEAAQPGLTPGVLRELPDKTIVLGVLDLESTDVETPEVVAGRIGAVLDVVSPDRLVVAPDCGMKYLPRERAFRKLQAMVQGAKLVDA